MKADSTNSGRSIEMMGAIREIMGNFLSKMSILMHKAVGCCVDLYE